MKAIAIDFGNSSAKAGYFESGKLIKKERGLNKDEVIDRVKSEKFDRLIFSSVSISYDSLDLDRSILSKTHFLTYESALNFNMQYMTPESLGADRIAAVAGAVEMFPDEDCMVIDAGSCITYEFIQAGAYIGGSISPGIDLRFKSLNTFTTRLPLLERDEEVDFLGNTTRSAIQTGVINGVIAEINDKIRIFQQKSRNLRLVICGGDADYLAKRLKFEINIAPDLVLTGLYAILKYNG